MNFLDLRENHKDLINTIGRDPFSCMDLIEAMESGDCMCICLDVVIPETDLVDPTKVEIKQIIPTFMTTESFIDSFTLYENGFSNSLNEILER